ncbi:MAG: UDPglucose 6-dehydrogenase [Halieaceae bacterium]|jgi:UDPglucose 6-dehydrogenase
MNISIIGSGYVGLVQAAVFADVGHRVVCMDVDKSRIDRLNDCEVPFYEPGLETLVKSGLASGLLSFTADAEATVTASDYLFVCVGTPEDIDGAADLKYVLQVAQTIGERMNTSKVVINKSTVPVGTADQVKAIIAKAIEARGKSFEIDVVSNPEFLKEGSAVGDCQMPDRIILGTDSKPAEAGLRKIYQAFNRNHEKILMMDARSAEMTKYAANAFLATKISFMNEMASIAEVTGADIEDVRLGIGSDPRIGFQFIYPGCGYGGACFPKDVRALQHLATENRYDSSIINAVDQTNQRQKEKLGQRILSRLGSDLTGKTIAIWGLSFKPNTDDMREAPSRSVMETVWNHGGSIKAYDPQANAACLEIYGERADLTLTDTKEDALTDADALVICTEWRTFRSPDFGVMMQELKQPIIFDGRNLYDPSQLSAIGLEYYGIGRGLSLNLPVTQIPGTAPS